MCTAGLAPGQRTVTGNVMTPQEIRELRSRLGCTARELADALGEDQQTVLAWERGDQFPTKRSVDGMLELDRKGPQAIARKPRRGATPAASPMQLLAEPETWRLFRKLLAYPELRREALRLADRFEEPPPQPEATGQKRDD